jgi:hypothetical protein
MSSIVDLSSYPAVQTAMFCALTLPTETATFTDWPYNYTLGTVSYTGLGQLMTITDTTSELAITRQQVTITISGLAANAISRVLSTNIKGSAISVQRALFDPQTHQLLSVSPNPMGKFQGYVNNYAVNETWSGTTTTNTVSLICNSRIDQHTNKVSGRRTNPADETYWFPADTAMANIRAIASTTYNFGGL